MYVLLGLIAVPCNVDVACCYRPNRVVCLSVCLSFTVMSPAKMAEPVELLFGLWVWVGSRNHVLDGLQIPHRKVQF